MNNESQPKLNPQQQKQYNKLTADIGTLDELNREDQKYVEEAEMKIALLLNSQHTETTDSEVNNNSQNVLTKENDINNRKTQKEKLNERLENIMKNVKQGPDLSSSNHKPKI